MTTSKTIASAIQTFIGKVKSLLFNTLSRFVIVSVQSTSCEMPGWMNHKLESRLLGEIVTVLEMYMIPL